MIIHSLLSFILKKIFKELTTIFKEKLSEEIKDICCDTHTHPHTYIRAYVNYWQLFDIYVQFCSVAQSCPTLCDPINCSTPGLPVCHQLAYSNSYPLCRWCHPTMSSSVVPFSTCLQSFFPNIRIFSDESSLHTRWPKYWGFSFKINPSNEHPGLISFRVDWLHLLAVQGTLKSLLQHHSSKVSILRCSAFFIVQLSHPHMTTGKTIALTRWTFVDKVMSLLFNMLSRLVITFLPKSKWFHGCSHHLQWFWSP